MEMIRRFPSEVLGQALSDWAWLPDLEGKEPLLTSAFGDVFLAEQHAGSPRLGSLRP